MTYEWVLYKYLYMFFAQCKQGLCVLDAFSQNFHAQTQSEEPVAAAIAAWVGAFS